MVNWSIGQLVMCGCFLLANLDRIKRRTRTHTQHDKDIKAKEMREIYAWKHTGDNENHSERDLERTYAESRERRRK